MMSYEPMQHAYSITCEQFIDGASDYIDEQLGAGAAAAMEVHLARCLTCARYHAVLMRGLALVHEAPVIEPSPDFGLRLHMKLRAVDDEMMANQRAVTSGVAVVLSVAILVAFAAWGPLLTPQFAGSPAQLATRTTALPGATDSPLNITPSPSATSSETLEWFVGPAGFSGVSLRPASLPATFPGPYSPLVVQPPAVGPVIQTSLSGNE